MTEVLPRGYTPMLDYDYNYLSAWEDYVLTTSKYSICFVCGRPTDRFNVDVGGYECGKCGGTDD